ncbi:MAG: glycosyltransferase family 4 protein [bacterium]|nr:glycosyltransferase family 4 protein [bacterium]
MKNIRVLQLTSTLRIGGAQLALLSLVKETKCTNVIVYSECDDMCEDLKRLGVKVIKLQFEEDDFPDKLCEIIKSERIDIVHWHGGGGQYNRFCYRFVPKIKDLGVKFVETPHCARPNDFPDDMIDAIVCSSNYTYSIQQKKSKSVVIPFGFDYSEYDRVYKDHLKFKNSKLQIGRLGRVEPIKIPHDTIKVANIVYECGVFQDVEFIVAGFVSGGLNYAFELARLSRPNTKLLFKTYTGEEKLKLINSFDIFLYPTSCESFGLSFVEAMFMGKPIITYDHWANKDTVGPGNIIVPFQDIRALFAATIDLITNKEKRERIGLENLQISRERFSGKIFGQRMLNLYESLR